MEKRKKRVGGIVCGAFSFFFSFFFFREIAKVVRSGDGWKFGKGIGFGE